MFNNCYYILNDGYPGHPDYRVWPKLVTDRVSEIMAGPFSRKEDAEEEKHAIEIAEANALPVLDDDFFQREGAWFQDRFVLTPAEYADLVENREAW